MGFWVAQGEAFFIRERIIIVVTLMAASSRFGIWAVFIAEWD